ncbi:MAG: hypothetical protein FJX54_12280 [Alphaproteobacteria bacterium]|nr:hypothetical protein [Alphaproteobacteria bacterium]
MLDLTSLIYALIVGFGIFGLDAAWNANTVRTDFTVSDTLGSAGVKPEFATVVFSRELEGVFAVSSLVKAPQVRSSHDKTFVSILAESVGLGNATAAFQDLFGLHPVKILSTLTTEGTLPRLEIVCEAGVRGTFYLSLEARESETAVSLIRRGAIEAAARLDPYHTALYLLDPPVGEPDTPKARRVLDEAIAVQVAIPVNPIRGRFHNLRGIVALLEEDKEAAASFFEKAILDDPNLAAGHLNLAFTRVEQDRYADAGMIVRHILQTRRKGLQPALLASANTINGVVAWSQKDYQAAGKHFQAATAVEPGVTDAYIYWGRMLIESGSVEEGRRRIRQGEANQAEFENYAEIALLYFWLTETDNQPLTRRPRGNGGIAAR